ncbi:MAG: acylphosphatase [Agathobacter sp.]|nr:acylphosphatase [Agathobacter sp.]MBQ2283839.1 acylphosphatase [Agathobacter sp.]
MEKIRKFLKIYGQVQGVGFRYRANYAADSLGVTGWVRNEWDGTVEMEVQGTESQINQLLTLINKGTYVNIEEIKSRQLPVEENESGFHVR